MPDTASTSRHGTGTRSVGERVRFAGQAHSAEEGEDLRRALNVVVAACGLVIALPVMVVIAVLIKLTSRGPVFYTQTRIGIDRRQASSTHPRRSQDLGGKPFKIYKFRTMSVDAERGTGAVWAQRNDPRVTPIGKILRETRLDEVPQLFNVLKGDMNVVGPRPERPSIVMDLKTSIRHYQQRHKVRPGITGLAQISNQYDSCLADVERKIAFDLEYIRRQSAWEDFKIMVQTIPVILFRRGGW